MAVSGVLPVAGPSAGGSLLNVSGAVFAALGEVLCRFGDEDRTTAGTVVSPTLVQCYSPSISAPMMMGGGVPAVGQPEPVEVSMNGQDYTSSQAPFLFFDKALVHVSSLVPFGGPLSGGTLVTVLGSGRQCRNGRRPSCFVCCARCCSPLSFAEVTFGHLLDTKPVFLTFKS